MPKRLLLLALLGTAAAQDEDLPPDEASDIVARYVERAQESLRQGGYEEARLRFAKALKRDPENVAARLGTATTYRLVGAYDKAEAEIDALLKARPDEAGALVAKAELALRRGRLGEANDLAQKVIGRGSGEGPELKDLRARILLAEALGRRGRRGDARTALEVFRHYYERRKPSYDNATVDRDTLKHKPEIAWPLAEELTVVATALRLYVDFSPLDEDFIANANELLLLALELDPENWDAWIEHVRVTRSERERAASSARKARDVVTEKNPELADLWAEVAKSLLTIRHQSGEAREMAETALKVNPKQTDARAIVAQVALEDNEYGTAEEHIHAGLAVDPLHRDLLALKATLDLLLGDEKKFEQGMDRLLEVDPTYGEGFHIAGQVIANRQRRYDRGVELVRRGLELDPSNFEAQATLGFYLANLGREAAAKEALDKSKQLFPWSHPMRENLRVILDYVLGTMTEMRTEHFVIRFDPREYEVLSLFLPEVLEESWADMTKRYGFTPEAPVIIEVFPKSTDFSVRAIGTTDYANFAIGICFGGLIALDSPQAFGKEFQWAATARHEFAHVMSLQLSAGQVPRWFTEGLSVLEEKPLDPGWGMEDALEREVYDALHTGTLPKIATFDAMFRTPRVGFAYYLGGLMVQFLHARSGEAGIVKALRLYGEDKPMEEVFEQAFGLKLEEFDDRFRDFLSERMKTFRRVPNHAVRFDSLRAKALAEPDDGETLMRLAWAHFFREEIVEAGLRLDQARAKLDPKDPWPRLLEAHLASRAGRSEQAEQALDAFFAAGGEDFDARMMQVAFHRRAGRKAEYVAALEKARACWPPSPAPLAQLRTFYMTEGREAEALKMLEEQARLASTSVPLRLQLAREYVARNRDADAMRVLEEAMFVTPFHREVHELALPLYREAGERKKAVRAARCLVALRAEDDTEEEQAARWLTLADVLLEDGRKEEAGAAVREAQRLAPEEHAERREELKKKLGQ